MYIIIIITIIIIVIIIRIIITLIMLIVIIIVIMIIMIMIIIIKGPDNPTSQLLPKMSFNGFSGDREGRKDKGDGERSRR